MNLNIYIKIKYYKKTKITIRSVQISDYETKFVGIANMQRG